MILCFLLVGVMVVMEVAEVVVLVLVPVKVQVLVVVDCDGAGNGAGAFANWNGCSKEETAVRCQVVVTREGPENGQRCSTHLTEECSNALSWKRCVEKGHAGLRNLKPNRRMACTDFYHNKDATIK